MEEVRCKIIQFLLPIHSCIFKDTIQTCLQTVCSLFPVYLTLELAQQVMRSVVNTAITFVLLFGQALLSFPFLTHIEYSFSLLNNTTLSQQKINQGL